MKSYLEQIILSEARQASYWRQIITCLKLYMNVLHLQTFTISNCGSDYLATCFNNKTRVIMAEVIRIKQKDQRSLGVHLCHLSCCLNGIVGEQIMYAY